MNKRSCKADLFDRMDVAGVSRLIMVFMGRENYPAHLMQAGRFGDGPARGKFLDISG